MTLTPTSAITSCGSSMRALDGLTWLRAPILQMGVWFWSSAGYSCLGMGRNYVCISVQTYLIHGNRNTDILQHPSISELCDAILQEKVYNSTHMRGKFCVKMNTLVNVITEIYEIAYTNANKFLWGLSLPPPNCKLIRYLDKQTSRWENEKLREAEIDPSIHSFVSEANCTLSLFWPFWVQRDATVSS